MTTIYWPPGRAFRVGALVLALAAFIGPASVTAQTEPGIIPAATAACIEAPTQACVFDIARTHALTLVKKDRALELARLAVAQADAGFAAEAEAMAKQSLDELNEVQSEHDRDEVYPVLVRAWVRLGKFAEAQGIIKVTHSMYMRSRSVAAIARAIGKAGNIPEAIRLAQSIADKRERDLTMRRVVWDLRYLAVARGEEDILIEAMRVVAAEEESISGRIEHFSEHSSAELLIAEALARKGKFAEAWQIVKTSQHNPGGHRIGCIQADAGDLPSLFRTTAEFPDHKERSSMLESILGSVVSRRRKFFTSNGAYMSFYMLHGEFVPFDDEETAGEIADLVAIPKLPEPNWSEAIGAAYTLLEEGERDYALGIIAAILANRGYIDQSQKLLRDIAHPRARHLVLRAIGRAQGAAGLAGPATVTLSEAEQIASTSERPYSERAMYLQNLAQELAEAGLMEEALRVAKSIDPYYDSQRGWAFKDIARAYAKVGKAKEAIETLQFREASTVDGGTVGHIVSVLAANGWVKEALETGQSIHLDGGFRKIVEERVRSGQIAQAELYAAAIEEPWNKALAYAAIGGAQSRNGRRTEAMAWFSKSLNAAVGIQYPEKRATALLFLAAQIGRQ